MICGFLMLVKGFISCTLFAQFFLAPIWCVWPGASTIHDKWHVNWVSTPLSAGECGSWCWRMMWRIVRHVYCICCPLRTCSSHIWQNVPIRITQETMKLEITCRNGSSNKYVSISSCLFHRFQPCSTAIVQNPFGSYSNRLASVSFRDDR